MALGKIKADTLEHSTAGTVDTQYVVKGSTKAHWLFEQANSNTLTVSLNVSSVTDNGTGDMTTAFTNSFSGAKLYSAGSTFAYQNDAIANAVRNNGNILRAAGTLRWLCVFVSSTGGGGSPEDDDENSWQLIGDLA